MKRGSRENPYAVQRLGPEGHGYCYAPGGGIEELTGELESWSWRCELVGPEGSGKTTLLMEIGRQLRARGFEPRLVRLHGDERFPSLRAIMAAARGGTLLLDGAELVPMAVRRLVFRMARCFGWKLVATVHRATPGVHGIMVRCEHGQFEALVGGLLGREAKPEEVAALAACDGNAREALFRLYDEHEARGP